MACRLKPGEIWLNMVGTCGMGCAAYWWERLSGAVVRAVLYLMFQGNIWQLLFADGWKWTIHGPRKYDNLVLALFVLELLGAPIHWGKCGGGLAGDWVGYWSDYAKLDLGLSEKRTAWLSEGLALMTSGRPFWCAASPKAWGGCRSRRVCWNVSVRSWRPPSPGPRV